MMGVCRVSRKMALETWRRELREIGVGECKEQWQGEQRGREAVKRYILEELDGLIETL